MNHHHSNTLTDGITNRMMDHIVQPPPPPQQPRPTGIATSHNNNNNMDHKNTTTNNNNNTTTTNSNSNNNNDDDDEFAHLSFDPTSFDFENNNNNYIDTNNNDNNNNDTVLDLQMTIVTMETEHNITIQQIQQQNKLQLRILQDELRKLQNETYVLRQSQHNHSNSNNNSNSNSNNSSHHHHTTTSTAANSTTTTTTNTTTLSSSSNRISKHSSLHPHHRPNDQPPQPHPQPPGSNLFARSNAILFPSNNSSNNNNHNSHNNNHGSSSTNTTPPGLPPPPPPQPQPPVASSHYNDNHDDCHYHSDSHRMMMIHTSEHSSSGQRLIYQLLQHQQPQQSQQPKFLLQTPTNNNTDNHDNMIALRLIQMMISSTSSASVVSNNNHNDFGKVLSEWEILHWFMVEMVNEQQQLQIQIQSPPNDQYLRSMLQWFYDAILLCNPLTYRNKLIVLSPPEQQQQSSVHKVRTFRKSSITLCHPNRPNNDDDTNNPNTISNNTTTTTTTTNVVQSHHHSAMYTMMEQRLSHPLMWLSSSLSSISHHQSRRGMLPPTIPLPPPPVNENDNVGVHNNEPNNIPSPLPHPYYSYYVQRFIQDGLFRWYDMSQLLRSTVLSSPPTTTTFSVPTTNNGTTTTTTAAVPLNQNNGNERDIHTNLTSNNSNKNNVPNSGTVSVLSSNKVLHNISVLAMQITVQLVSNPRRTTTTMMQSSSSSSLIVEQPLFHLPDHCCNCLLVNILHIGNHLLLHHPPHRKHFYDIEMNNSDVNSKMNIGKSKQNNHRIRKSKGINVTKEFSDFVPPPLRLIHVEYMEEHIKPKRPADVSSKALWSCFDEQDSLTWMAEALNLLQMVVWAETKHSTTITSLELEWIQTKRTASLMGMLLDVLEYTILPNVSLYTHPFTMTCVRWMQRLIDEPLALLSTHDINAQLLDNSIDDEADGRYSNSSRNNYTTNSNYYYWRLLRTQNVTTDSTAELWQTSPTAINILLQIFTRIVLHQTSHDHIPSEAVQVVPLLPLRDAIIRFMHSILLHVQKDRQLWEQQHYQMKQSKTTAAATAKSATKKRMRPILSFIIILSDQVEIYKSMITILLSSNNPASVTNLDCGLTNAYYCMNEDLYAMLQLQLEEITDDQYEKLQHG